MIAPINEDGEKRRDMDNQATRHKKSKTIFIELLLVGISE